MNVLFDLDGTLTDPKVGITRSVCYALEQMGVEPPEPETLTWVIGPPLQASLAQILCTEDASISERCLDHYRVRFGEIGLFENFVYEGVPPMLEALKSRGNRLFVATSKPTAYSLRILDHFNLSASFDAIYGSDLDGTRTDKGELLAHLLEAEGLAVAETIMVGDRKHDVIGARKNGLKAVGVLYGYGTLAELREAGADAIVERPGEIVTAVTGLVNR